MAQIDLSGKIKEGLNDQAAWKGRHRAFGVIRPGMQRMVQKHPELTKQLRELKQYSIGHMDELVEQAVAAMKRKGVQVYVADTEEQAKQYIAGIVGQKLVVKSKTNAGKEIGIAKYLQKQGANVIETDLGDRLVQLEGKDKSTHTMVPAIHIPIEDVTTLLSDNVGRELECDLKILVRAARESLREYFTTAEIGISGANAIDAETGSIFLTENEGNIRCVTSMPRVHIAIAGIEKIVPKFTDGLTVVKAAAAYGVGQDIGTYISIIDGVSRYNNAELNFLGTAQGPEEVHVVLLTQGRREAVKEGFAESLYCINCGSCLNFCPVYAEIGQHYGYKYLGGRGAVFSAFHGNGLDKAQEAGLSLCIGCRRCEEACAVGMHTPEMISELRGKIAKEEGLGAAKQSVFKVLGSNKLAPLMKVARNVQGIGLKRQENGANLRVNLDKIGVPANRLLPMLAKESFAEQMMKKSHLANPKARVAFFGGCLINYANPELGVDVYDILAANQVQMIIYQLEACCGLPAIMSGDTETALRLAKTNINLFFGDMYEYIVFACPSCAATVKREWAALVAQENNPELTKQYENVRAKVIDLNEYLFRVLKVSVPKLKEPVRVTYHDSCHMARSLNVMAEPRALLQQAGAVLIEMEDAASCCGFGGSFSLFYYELSKRVNDAKIRNAQATEAAYIAASCPGCVMHLKDGVNRAGGTQKVVHVAQILAAAYRGGNIK